MGNVLENEVKPIHKMGIYEKYIKRPLDFILSLCAILVLSPVLLLVAILVKIKLGSPVIFKQERPGLYGKIFNMYKFRTMTDEKDETETCYRMKNALLVLERCCVVQVR